MSKRRKQIGALVGGAAALAFAGYTLGSQTGDGVATADSSSSGSSGRTTAVHDRDRGDRGPGGFGLDGLADRLGVEPSALQKALQDLRPRKDARDDLAAALAAKLNLDKDDVASKLEKLRPDRDGKHEELAAALAKELGKDAADVRAALEKVRPEPGDRGRHRRGDRRAALDALAKELNVTPAKLRAAFDEIRPDKPPRGDRRGRRGPALDDLAKALGVTTDKLQSAFDEIHSERRDAFAKALADKLNIPVSKVKDALPEGGPGGGPHRRHGP
jgi:transcriptional regulator with XRE-family HTH domain